MKDSLTLLLLSILVTMVPYAGMEEVIVGVVGTLQFDVFEYRMKSEYGVNLRMAGLPYDHLRRISACPGDPKDLTLCADAVLLEDFKGRSLIAYSGEWPVGYLLTVSYTHLSYSYCNLLGLPLPT